VLKTSDYGDDKDRVMRKSDGGSPISSPTWLTITKWERGFV
jgi:hypothetical protein